MLFRVLHDDWGLLETQLADEPDQWVAFTALLQILVKKFIVFRKSYFRKFEIQKSTLNFCVPNPGDFTERWRRKNEPGREHRGRFGKAYCATNSTSLDFKIFLLL